MHNVSDELINALDHDYITDTLKALDKISSKEYVKFLAFDLAALLPKKTKSLTTNFLKHVTAAQNDPLVLVLIAHLYLDHILNRMFERKSYPLNQRTSFFEKVRVLEKQGDLEEEFAQRFRFVNQLRNNFAHDLFFDIANWNPYQDEWIRAHSTRRSRVPKHARAKTLYCLSCTC